MDKKILFISELGHEKKVPRDYRHMRTEFAQMCALRADHLSIYKINEFDKSGYDHVILLISKSPQLREFILTFDIVEKSREFGDKVWFMQEATSWIHQTMGLPHQINHINILNSVDGILSENITDYKYYGGVAPNTPVHTIPTLIIEDYLLDARKTEKQNKTMIGGNCSNWYGGFDSYLVADIYENQIDMPKMRNVDLHDQLPRLTVLPHVQFTDWICYKVSDTQRICQPDLSVDLYDVERARMLADKLNRDSDFYNHCSETALKNYNKNYNEKVFIEHMTEVLN